MGQIGVPNEIFVFWVLFYTTLDVCTKVALYAEFNATIEAAMRVDYEKWQSSYRYFFTFFWQ